MLLSLESRDRCDMPLQALLGQGLQLIRAWVCLQLTQMLKFKLLFKDITGSGSKGVEDIAAVNDPTASPGHFYGLCSDLHS